MLIARDADQVPSGAVGRRAIVSTGTVGLPKIVGWPPSSPDAFGPADWLLGIFSHNGGSARKMNLIMIMIQWRYTKALDVPLI